jgi:hypothetical protein
MSSSEIAGDLETRSKPANASAKRTFFIMLIFQFCAANTIHGTVWVERPARSRKIFENKKPPDFAKRGMEEIRRATQKQFGWTGLILLFAEKWPEKIPSRDEHNQTGILTSASNLTPAFPIFRPVALGVCSRYSGATVPDSHRVP